MFERYNALFDRDPGQGPAGTVIARPGAGGAGGSVPAHRPDIERMSLPAVSGLGPVPMQPADPDVEPPEADDWDSMKPLWRGPRGAARRGRDLPAGVAAATDALRTQLLQAVKAERCCRVAVTAPTSGCGATFTSINLALAMAAIPDVGVVLLDLNQRHPDIAPTLGNASEQRIAELLRGDVGPMDYLRRYGDNLAIGLNCEPSPNPAELLQTQSAADMLDEVTGYLAPDVILCDMPPLLEYDDAMAFLPQLDAVLLVADATRTSVREMSRCLKMLEGRTTLLGVVLNRGRAPRRETGR